VRLSDETDLGNTPIQNDVLDGFRRIGQNANFADVSNEIDVFIYGNDFAAVTAGMSPLQIEQYKVACWSKFQDTRLIPAMNSMMPPTTAAMNQLSPPLKMYTPTEHHMLSQLEFFATNLYTKETAAGNTNFYYALNRVLLQVDPASQEVRINSKPYDDNKKLFNVWFFLFLSGLQKLIVAVPAMYTTDPDNPRINPTVRLYRGLSVEESKSQDLWKPPVLVNLTDSADSTNSINVYTTLAFSSYTTKLDTSCEFSGKNPNIMVFEPRRGKINLPSLQIISDIPTENEYLMFPNYSVMVFSRETEVQSKMLNEKCKRTRVYGVKIPPINWIGITDVTDVSLREGITQLESSSGGRHSTTRRRRHIIRSRRRRNNRKHKKTQKGRKHDK